MIQIEIRDREQVPTDRLDLMTAEQMARWFLRDSTLKARQAANDFLRDDKNKDCKKKLVDKGLWGAFSNTLDSVTVY